MVLVIAAVAASLHGGELGKFLLPIAQHMGLDTAQLGYFADGEVAFCRNGGQGGRRHESLKR